MQSSQKVLERPANRSNTSADPSHSDPLRTRDCWLYDADAVRFWPLLLSAGACVPLLEDEVPLPDEPGSVFLFTFGEVPRGWVMEPPFEGSALSLAKEEDGYVLAQFAESLLQFEQTPGAYVEPDPARTYYGEPPRLVSGWLRRGEALTKLESNPSEVLPDSVLVRSVGASCAGQGGCLQNGACTMPCPLQSEPDLIPFSRIGEVGVLLDGPPDCETWETESEVIVDVYQWFGEMRVEESPLVPPLEVHYCHRADWIDVQPADTTPMPFTGTSIMDKTISGVSVDVDDDTHIERSIIEPRLVVRSNLTVIDSDLRGPIVLESGTVMVRNSRVAGLEIRAGTVTLTDVVVTGSVSVDGSLSGTRTLFERPGGEPFPEDLPVIRGPGSLDLTLAFVRGGGEMINMDGTPEAPAQVTLDRVTLWQGREGALTVADAVLDATHLFASGFSATDEEAIRSDEGLRYGVQATNATVTARQLVVEKTRGHAIHMVRSTVDLEGVVTDRIGERLPEMSSETQLGDAIRIEDSTGSLARALGHRSLLRGLILEDSNTTVTSFYGRRNDVCLLVNKDAERDYPLPHAVEAEVSGVQCFSIRGAGLMVGGTPMRGGEPPLFARVTALRLEKTDSACGTGVSFCGIGVSVTGGELDLEDFYIRNANRGVAVAPGAAATLTHGTITQISLGAVEVCSGTDVAPMLEEVHISGTCTETLGANCQPVTEDCFLDE